MPDHYFSQNPTSDHNIYEFDFAINEKTLRFVTDAGVFSREKVDQGSELLIKKIVADLVTENRSPARLLDLGCGFGAVGLFLASYLPDTEVLMCDINSRAVELCGQNITRNKLTNASVLLSDGLSAVEGYFDIIVSNPPIRAGKTVIYDLFAQSRQKLSADGSLYIVIRKKQGAPSAKAHLETLFENVETIGRGGGYHVIKATIG